VYLKFLEGEENKKNTQISSALTLFQSKKTPPKFLKILRINITYVYENLKNKRSSYQNMPCSFNLINMHIANSYFAYKTLRNWKEKVYMLMEFCSSMRNISSKSLQDH